MELYTILNSKNFKLTSLRSAQLELNILTGKGNFWGVVGLIREAFVSLNSLAPDQQKYNDKDNNNKYKDNDIKGIVSLNFFLLS